MDDWYLWLSKSGLEPALVYNYSLAFVRNELKEEDVGYFNPEFLQSMGIDVAKHRLEILKLARTKVVLEGCNSTSLSKLVWATSKTKSLFSKNVVKLAFQKGSPRRTTSELVLDRSQWTGALSKNRSGLPNKIRRSTMKSGPLDAREHKKLMAATRGVSLSGPLDGKMQDRLMLSTWSPAVFGPVDGRVKERLVYSNR